MIADRISPTRLNRMAHDLGRIGTRPIPSQPLDLKSTLKIKGSHDLISTNKFEINGYDFLSRWGIWDSIVSAHHRIDGQGRFSPRTIMFTPERGCGILPAVVGPPASDGCCEDMDEMSLWLMAWGVIMACIYIGWEVGGYMIDLIWYLSLTIISYILGTLTNSNPNLLHDRSNLVLICYNLILSIRNSNKLNSRVGNSDARSGKWNKT
jgi:hypothetical protein